MKNIFIILFITINTLLNGATYYIAPTTATPAGSDANAGTIAAPWATWKRGMEAAEAGDTVYFRGGVYPSPITNGAGVAPTFHQGAEGDTIYFFNYPGEVPILDFNAAIPSGSKNYGLTTSVTYCYFKGLMIRNVWSVNSGVECAGWRVAGQHTIIENCKVYNIHGPGFQALNLNVELHYINCDAWDCCDSLAVAPSLPGNKGTGFGMLISLGNESSTVYYKNCRAWDCGDQGFAAYSSGYVEWENCWSFLNGRLSGGGHGFKLGYVPVGTALLSPNRKIINCIAAYNKSSGITTNDLNRDIASMYIYNNTCYKNAYGYYVYNSTGTDEQELLRVFKNNIAYGNTTINFGQNVAALYTHSNNSWDSNVTVTDADFVSVDSTGLAGARGEDGSLPDLDFLKLVSTSDLIDAGTDVGITYYNNAPDLGFYEYPTFPETSAPYINTNEPMTLSTRFVYNAGGNMIFDGGGTISAKGVCYSQESNPTVEDSIIWGGTGTADFTVTIKPLTANTTYHVRAYATNETGTAYGADVSFTTPKHSYLQYKGKPVVIQ